MQILILAILAILAVLSLGLVVGLILAFVQELADPETRWQKPF